MRTVVALVLLALVLAACGDDDTETTASSTSSSAEPTSSTTSSTTSTPRSTEPEPAAGVVELSAEVPSSVEAGPVAWELDVTNASGGDIVLTFPTAQPGDAVLLDGDRVVHRWSDGRFFAQVIQEKRLAAGESFTIQLEDDLSSVEPGTYTLQLSLAVVGPPEPVEQTVRVVRAG